jgi:hypothetical protein
MHSATYPSDNAATALYRTTTGSYVKVANLPAASYYSAATYQDNHCTPIIRNSKAYVFQEAAPIVGGQALVGVTEINLTTGATKSFQDGTVFSLPAGETDTQGFNGLWGRCAWVPEAGCFVVMLSPHRDVWVFRPPSSWGVA